MRSFRRATTNLISEIAIQSHSDVQSRLVLHEKREIVTITSFVRWTTLVTKI